MMILMTKSYRGIHVMGCGDCPFANEHETACEIIFATADDPAAAAIAPEHDMKTLPAWCPLRDGDITVRPEPGSLKASP